MSETAPYNKIEVNSDANTRYTLGTEAEIEDLAVAIVNNNWLQPVGVYKQGRKFVLVNGFRRMAALAIIRSGGGTRPELKDARPDFFEEVPVQIVDKKDAPIVNMLENLHRKDLSIVEQGDMFCKIKDLTGYTQEELSEKVGLSRSHVGNAMRIVTSLAPEILADLRGRASTNMPKTPFLFKLAKLDHKEQLELWAERNEAETDSEEDSDGEGEGSGGGKGKRKRLRNYDEIEFFSRRDWLPVEALEALQWVMGIRPTLPGQPADEEGSQEGEDK